MNRSIAGTPGWYRLTIDGQTETESEDLVTLCITAREIGARALVVEIAHPKYGHAPFGLWASGDGLRHLCGMAQS